MPILPGFEDFPTVIEVIHLETIENDHRCKSYLHKTALRDDYVKFEDTLIIR